LPGASAAAAAFDYFDAATPRRERCRYYFDIAAPFSLLLILMLPLLLLFIDGAML